MPSRELIEKTVRTHFEAWNAGDRERWIGNWHDSVVMVDPVGGPEQGAFYNIVVELDTDRTPRQLLALCHELEQAAGRVRVVRWGPRTLDVDVLLVGDLVVADDDLSVPHPRMTDRNFVMVPLLDVAPDLDVAGYDPATAIGDVRNIGPL